MVDNYHTMVVSGLTTIGIGMASNYQQLMVMAGIYGIMGGGYGSQVGQFTALQIIYTTMYTSITESLGSKIYPLMPHL